MTTFKERAQAFLSVADVAGGMDVDMLELFAEAAYQDGYAAGVAAERARQAESIAVTVAEARKDELGWILTQIGRTDIREAVVSRRRSLGPVTGAKHPAWKETT